jgi:hypothetical protein
MFVKAGIWEKVCGAKKNSLGFVAAIKSVNTK